MKPKSFSATAFQVAETCMARYYAENILKTARPNNLAADLGTAVHGALEMYVREVHINKAKPESLNALLFIYRMVFCQVFETVDPDSSPWYEDGVTMLKVWFARTDFRGREVISVETKTNFEIATSIGKIPFNYVWDRFDKILDRDEEYEVVDYKTIRKSLSPSDLRAKIQARCYGLAAQIQIPTAKRVWVRFDLLRHDSVATVFTREDNIATWNFVKAVAEKIISTDETAEEGLPETLNAECNFCVRKASCKALLSNVTGGGIWSLTDRESRIDARAKLGFQQKGLAALIEEVDIILLKDAAENDLLELESKDYRAKVTQGFRQGVDGERVQHVVGDELFNKYGGVRLTMADFKKLLKDPKITAELRVELNKLVYRNAGDLKIAIEPKNPIDE